MSLTSPPPASTTPAASPCIKVCVIDGESGLCLGCLRTLAEVAAWARLGETQRAAILAALPDRPARVSPEKRAMFGLGS